MAIRIVRPGLLTTVQDLGRYGYAHLGVSPAGAADPLALRVANLLLNNDENTAALEMTLLGPTVEFEKAGLVALTGADIECRLGTAKAPMWKPFPVIPGAVLKCGVTSGGSRTYLAVAGGFEVTPILASAATLRSAKLGGVEGRALRAGDTLRLRHPTGATVRHLSPEALAFLRPRKQLRITPGPQASWFSSETLETLQRSTYVVSDQSDRGGVRLRGEPLPLANKSAQLLTEGISLGAMQVPPDGQPIILLVDQQTTGGYPKIANVIAADLRHVGQLRPHEPVRFVAVDFAQALAHLREQQRWLHNTFGGNAC